MATEMTTPENQYEQLTVTCGMALEERYAGNPQSFHHAPTVAAVVLEAIPDGWAKWNGQWVRIFQAERWDTYSDRTLLVTDEED